MKRKILSAMLAMTMAMSMLVGCGGSSGGVSTAPGGTTSSSTPSSNTGDTSTDDAGSQTTTAAKREKLTPSGATTTISRTEDATGQVIIGNTTAANADMMTGWTNSATNADVKILIHGASTVAFTEEGTYEPNYAVLAKEIEQVENEDGTKTFTMTIKEDLKFNDGTPITAHNYLFGTMLTSSPEFGSLDASNTTGIQYVGFDEFNAGDTKTISGFKLLGDYEFSATVKAEELPYFYDITLASFTPYPMHVIAPDVTLTDDGEGATLSDNFTSELVAKTINDPATGYRYNPTVTAGAYQFVSYDPSSFEIVIETNPNYCGSYDGTFPAIEKLIFKYLVNATQFDELAAGSVDILAGISGGDSINTGLDLVDNGGIDYTSYPRAGYGKIAFSCNYGPSQFQSVRQAIAYCLDREEFAREYTGGFGKLTHGYYGLSQWEYKANASALETELNQYTKNLEVAEQLLIDDGWTLNSSGGEYVKGTDAVRYKEVDGELMGLEIEWANSPDNPISDLLSIKLPDAFAEVGMKLNPTTVEFTVLLENYYQNNDSQKYHMYNLATGFATTSAHWYYFNKDLDQYGGLYNTNFISDEKLHDIAQDLKATTPGDNDAWAAKWLDLQIRWNELLPEVPLYSDEYHEFFNDKIQAYTPSALWDVAYAIQYASVTE